MDAVALSTVPAEAASAASGSAQPVAIDPAEARHFSGLMAEGRASSSPSAAPLQSVYSALEQFIGGTSAPSGEALASRIAPASSLRDTESAIVEFGRQQLEIVQFSNQSMTYFSKMHICTAFASACSNQFNSLLKSNG